ncbi:PorP/SprF family type IX secretion system membrane protein [Luteirhabdus pelagi]|uniref:PorP/SprF family type IX secretion system membrane protein n=1 Tax=Luteirhabdus pelagi TaxID=2792783 RepID=UPI00193A29A1|nr:type IX secretion system membrane protein PorP/SprF [Luteirhabdus pelagi]
MKTRILALLMLCGLTTMAQQEPQYTQFMYNMSIVNPAYMINEPGIIEVGTLYRSQWVGIEGAPRTANVFAHIPLNERIELSVNYLNDQIGDVISENVFNVDFAYKIKLNETLNLSFGIKAGVDNLNFDFSETNVASDPLFANTQKTVLRIGTGAYLFKSNYYIGLSAPTLLPNDISSDANGALYENKPHLFLIGGYIFDLNEKLKLKPAAVVKEVFGAPLSFDISMNMLYANRFEFGVAYRYQDAVSALAGFQLTPNLRIGYAYDYNISPLNDFNDGSHEFILGYTFDLLGLSKNYSSPRFY